MSMEGYDFTVSEVESVTEMLTLFVIVYSGLFSATLLIFGAMQVKLILTDVTSNENIRGKWNATR